jgi:hypothetical protein
MKTSFQLGLITITFLLVAQRSVAAEECFWKCDNYIACTTEDLSALPSMTYNYVVTSCPGGAILQAPPLTWLKQVDLPVTFPAAGVEPTGFQTVTAARGCTRSVHAYCGIQPPSLNKVSFKMHPDWANQVQNNPLAISDSSLKIAGRFDPSKDPVHPAMGLQFHFKVLNPNRDSSDSAAFGFSSNYAAFHLTIKEFPGFYMYIDTNRVSGTDPSAAEIWYQSSSIIYLSQAKTSPTSNTTISPAQLQSLYNYMRNNRVTFQAKPGGNKMVGSSDFPFRFSTCAHLGGNGPRRFAFSFGNSTGLNYKNAYLENIAVYMDGLKETFPFSENFSNNLAFYMDLASVADEGLSSDPTAAATNSLSRLNACSGLVSQPTQNHNVLLTAKAPAAGLYLQGKNSMDYKSMIWMNPSAGAPYTVVANKQAVFNHQVGHEVCALVDEFRHPDADLLPSDPEDFANCTRRANPNYLSNGSSYARAQAGCFKSKDSEGIQYRPSANSVMNNSAYLNLASYLQNPTPPIPFERRFNAVSCGHCRAALLGGDPRSHYAACYNSGNIVQ